VTSKHLADVHCKLCLKSTQEVGPLKISHIIPRFILLMSKTAGRALTFSLPSGSYDVSQEDWKEPMLCSGCELVMKHLEDLINEVFFLRRKTAVRIDGPKEVVIATYSDRLALALISIFWRAAISSHPAYRLMLLPAYMTDEMRDWIRVGRMPTRWHALVEIKLEKVTFPEDVDLRCLIAPFHRDGSETRGFQFVFICGGYCWTFTIPPARDQIFSRSGALRPASQSVRINKVRFSEIPELHMFFSTMQDKPVPQEVEAKFPKPRLRPLNI
jgi:hypothetical protein